MESKSNGLGAGGPSSSQQQQQQQQQQAAGVKQNTNQEMTQADRQREQALQEAQEVLESMGANQLDHFNLLGVVANPRGSQHGPTTITTSSSAMSSLHGPTSVASSMHSGIGGGGGGGDAASTASSSFLFSDTYQTFEYTIGQVTEQIEALNHVFEDWSRQYLNDYYYHQDTADAIPESQLQELPPELTQLDMSALQVYLQKSGLLAQTFQQHYKAQLLKRKKQFELEQRIIAKAAAAAATAASAAGDSTGEESQAIEATTTSTTTPSLPDTTTRTSPHNSKAQNDLMDIPELFFQSDFDLTDPKTFRELLLSDDGNHDASMDTSPNSTGGSGHKNSLTTVTITSSSTSTNTASSHHASLHEQTHELFQIPPPDHFTGYLDKVEVALLEQVREKSEAFFQETNRFAQLKEWVGELLLDVQRIRGLLEGQSRAIHSWQQVPQWDRKRKQLLHMERILEGSNDILRCKQCIGGLLSAKDDLGAVEQIQYARLLLAGTAEEEEEDNDAVDVQSSHAMDPKQPQHASEKEAPIELGRLQALRTVGEQLNQYESLVVTSLTEEVVEIFLDWNTSTLASMYGLSNGGIPTSSRASSQHEIQRRTLDIIQSLNMCHALSHMTKFYSTRLHDMVRMTVRTTVGEFATDSTSQGPGTSVSVSVTAMTLERFIDCLDMLFEQILALLTSAAGVDEFCQNEGLTLRDEAGTLATSHGSNNGAVNGKGGGHDMNSEANTIPKEKGSNETAIKAIVTSAAELSSKSIAELLRLRKEVHALVSLDEMRQIWDTCMKFAEEVEKLSGHKCVALRSMLLTQAKAFVERKHDSNMTSLAAALDSERWTQCEVSAERQMALTRLCSGRAGVSSARGRLLRTTSLEEGLASSAKSPDAEVEGIRYKVVWSCLLLVEMIMTNIEAAACFQSLASNVVGKVSELLRLFNSRATQLVLGAGAIHSAARLKSINAKHLSLVTQCLGMIIALLPHIRAALMAQLPPKQYTLLTDLDKIKKEYADHNEKVLNKFVTIIGGIVEHGLAKHIGGTDFDARAKDGGLTSDNEVTCCVFLEGVLTNTRKMHQVLSALLPPEHLQDVFSRIFAFIDQKIPALLIAAAENGGGSGSSGRDTEIFSFPKSEEGKKRLLDEVGSITTDLNALSGIFPWEFSAVSVIAKTLEYESPNEAAANEESTTAETSDSKTDESVDGETGGPDEEPADEKAEDEEPVKANGDHLAAKDQEEDDEHQSDDTGTSQAEAEKQEVREPVADPP